MTDSNFAKETLSINIEDEMKKSYLDYAMSVIVGRALPDVRDGLKPVHRRILYSMYLANNLWSSKHRKSSKTVGDTLNNFHPHGDSAVYDTIVRLAQDFSMRYVLIDGQGNFGSVDGDGAAAMRYTEIRLAKISKELLTDIEKETVDFIPNYDNTTQEPTVLPSRIPNLLINGSSGIAVGMATNIPPHNLGEIINGSLALLQNENITIEELIKYIPGPDFPTKGIIFGIKGIHQAYATGRGTVIIRGKTHIEKYGKNEDREAIIIDEIPYQVNKAKLVEKIGDLVRNKILEGISDLRDESDRSGMRVVIELKRNENADVILNQLYKLTQLQDSFGINMISLVDGQPRQLNLKQILEEFLKHRREVVTRRTIFELRKAKNRAHILEGLAVALSNVDEIIALIKASKTPAEAKGQLLSRRWKSSLVNSLLFNNDNENNHHLSKPDGLSNEFGLDKEGFYQLTEVQAQAILDLRLQRLTGLEQDKIINEYKEILNIIIDLIDILSNRFRVTKIIENELLEIKENYSDARLSKIDPLGGDIDDEDLIPEQDMVVTLSHGGYIKAQPIDDYNTQNRGGRGKLATSTKEEDFIETLLIANSHEYLLCFTNLGRCYWIKLYKIPQGGRHSRGRPVNNILNLQENETITAILSTKEFRDDEFIFMCTSTGIVKKTPITAFSNPRSSGIIAINLEENETLIGVEKTNGSYEIMLFSNLGKAVRFEENQIRPLGRTARGVKGMSLGKDGRLINILVIDPKNDQDKLVLTATENGYGKRTDYLSYRKSNRGSKGVIAIDTSTRNGKLVGAELVSNNDDLMLITSGGILIRTKVEQIRATGRAAQGVKLINLDDNEKLVCLAKIIDKDDDNEESPNNI